MEEQDPALASCSENQGPMILGVSYSLLAVPIITVILRLHLRFGLRHGLNSDDHTILASLVSRLLAPQSSTAIADCSSGRCHNWDRVFDQIGGRRTREAYLVPATGTVTPSIEMEHYRSDLEHRRNWPSQNIGVPLCAEDHR